MNILEYVKSKNTRISAESPFNNVDALVLSQLTYTKAEVIVNAGDVIPDPSGVPLKEFYRAEYFSKMFGDGMTDGENLQLFIAACGSPRYRDLRIKYMEEVLDHSSEKQFAAATYVLDGDTEFVSFRGTDGSLLGWKEDFNMAFMDEVPSQRAAVSYLNRHFGAHGESAGKRIYVGGHSKGGNLAIYGGLNAERAVRKRIACIYSLEGQGFREEVSAHLMAVATKEAIPVIKIVPQTSLIGMIMDYGTPVRVVEARAIGPMQHSAHTWQIDGDDFRYTTMSYTGEFNGRVLKEWLEKFSDEERKVIVDRFFDLLLRNDIRTVHDIRRIGPSKIRELLESFGDLDEESRSAIQSALAELGKTALLNIPPDEILSLLRRDRPWKSRNRDQDR